MEEINNLIEGFISADNNLISYSPDPNKTDEENRQERNQLFRERETSRNRMIDRLRTSAENGEKIPSNKYLIKLNGTEVLSIEDKETGKDYNFL